MLCALYPLAFRAAATLYRPRRRDPGLAALPWTPCHPLSWCKLGSSVEITELSWFTLGSEAGTGSEPWEDWAKTHVLVCIFECIPVFWKDDVHVYNCTPICVSVDVYFFQSCLLIKNAWDDFSVCRTSLMYFFPSLVFSSTPTPFHPFFFKLKETCLSRSIYSCWEI